jgi:hypothetical protein
MEEGGNIKPRPLYLQGNCLVLTTEKSGWVQASLEVEKKNLSSLSGIQQRPFSLQPSLYTD